MCCATVESVGEYECIQLAASCWCFVVLKIKLRPDVPSNLHVFGAETNGAHEAWSKRAVADKQSVTVFRRLASCAPCR